MSALAPLRELGLVASITITGSLRLKGLSTLPKDQAARVVEYAREHKPAIIAELSSAPKLPEACPLHGGPMPNACRFHPRFFKRMVAEGVLPTPEGCPLLMICKLAGYEN
jgi:hypothetical protein